MVDSCWCAIKQPKNLMNQMKNLIIMKVFFFPNYEWSLGDANRNKATVIDEKKKLQSHSWNFRIEHTKFHILCGLSCENDDYSNYWFIKIEYDHDNGIGEIEVLWKVSMRSIRSITSHWSGTTSVKCDNKVWWAAQKRGE